MAKEEIRKEYRDMYEKIREFRYKLENELHSKCEKYFDHEFWDWQSTGYFNAVNEWVPRKTRSCAICRKTEEKYDE